MFLPAEQREKIMKKGPLCVLICYLFWGMLAIFWKLLAAIPPVCLLALRILWSVVFIGGILLVRRRGDAVRAVLRDRKEWLRLSAAGVLICINWGVYIWAVNSGHILDSSLAYYMNPILAIALGTLLFGERLSGLQWMSVAVTAAGLVIAVLRYGRFPWASLVIGGSFALYGAVKKKVHSDADISLFFETLTLTPVMAAIVLWSELHGAGAIGALHGWQWLLLPMAGVVTTLPLLFFAVGIKETSMTLSGILMYVNPTLQLLIGVLLYHERFTTTHGILFGFVWTGLALYLISSLRRREKEIVR